MKIILGINAYHADSSACIIVNNKIIAAVEEERINRKKHYSGFPIESIKECIQIANIDDSQITDIAFNTRPLSNIIHKSLFFLKNLNLKNQNSINRFKKKLNIKTYLTKNFNFKKKLKIHYIEHHILFHWQLQNVINKKLRLKKKFFFQTHWAFFIML
jgi:carbamoyltransferase